MDEFELLVEEAIESLPDDLREFMSNVAIVVDEEPPPGLPLLGLYQGVPLTQRTSGYAGVAPDKITIYRGPLERRAAGDSDRLRAEYGVSSCTRSPTTSGFPTSVCSSSTATKPSLVEVAHGARARRTSVPFGP